MKTGQIMEYPECQTEVLAFYSVCMYRVYIVESVWGRLFHSSMYNSLEGKWRPVWTNPGLTT